MTDNLFGDMSIESFEIDDITDLDVFENPNEDAGNIESTASTEQTEETSNTSSQVTDDKPQGTEETGTQEKRKVDGDEGLVIERADLESFDEHTENTEDTSAIPNDKDSSQSLNSLTPYALSLKEQGILQSLDEDAFKTADTSEHAELLQKAMNVELETRIGGWVESLAPDVKKVVQYALKGIPVKEAIESTDKQAVYSNMNPDTIGEDENLMKQILLEDKVSRDMTEEEALAEIDALADLEAPAKLALKRINKRQENFLKDKEANIEKEHAAREEQRQKALKDLEFLSKNTKEVIPGMRINEPTRKKVYDRIVNPVETSDGKKVNSITKLRMEDPMGFDFKLNYLLEVTNNMTDFSKIKLSTKQDALRQMQQQLDQSDHKEYSKMNTAPSQGGSDTTADFLRQHFLK